MKTQIGLEKMLVWGIVLSLLVTGMIIPTGSASAPATGSTPTIRIYGEADAIYPTQSYSGTEDFIYNEESQPFDPKDEMV